MTQESRDFAATPEMFERACDLQMAANQELAVQLFPGHKSTRAPLTDAERTELAHLTELIGSR